MVRSVRLWEDRGERGEAGRHGTADTMPAVRKEVETMTDENENMRRCLSCDHICGVMMDGYYMHRSPRDQLRHKFGEYVETASEAVKKSDRCPYYERKPIMCGDCRWFTGTAGGWCVHPDLAAPAMCGRYDRANECTGFQSMTGGTCGHDIECQSGE